MYLNRVQHSFTEWNGRFITVPFKTDVFYPYFTFRKSIIFNWGVFVKVTCKYLQQRSSEVKVSVKINQFLGKKNDDIFPGC